MNEGSWFETNGPTQAEVEALLNQRGHKVNEDPPANTLSRVQRWTCSRCGKAALKHGAHWYGSAIEPSGECSP